MCTFNVLSIVMKALIAIWNWVACHKLHGVFILEGSYYWEDLQPTCSRVVLFEQ